MSRVSIVFSDVPASLPLMPMSAIAASAAVVPCNDWPDTAACDAACVRA